MLNIPEALKDIYKNDRFPFTDEVTPKDLTVYFPALDLTIGTDQIVDDSFELSESICTADDLIFGSCEAAQIKFTVADVEEDLKGQWFTVSQTIEGYDPVPLGLFKVESCVRQDDLRFKEIITYNALKYTDVNVADWYNSLFPIGNEVYTLKQFRESLLNYLGIEYEDENLPNDDMTVTKTIEPSSISGREVLKRCAELQGGFGQINRQGRFCHKILQPAYGLYPSVDLYPAEDLYPVTADDTTYINENLIDETVDKHENLYFEEYTVKEIDKLIIRSEEDDVGAIYGDGSNAYIIQGNFLVYGKSAEELQEIARRAFGNMARRPYRPYEGKCIGLPYIEPGDTVQFDNYGNPVTGYVLERTLTGIQVLTDNYIASGNEEREQNFGVNEEIIQLQGKVTRIRKDVEGVLVEVEDIAQELYAGMEILAGQIVLKVDASGNVAAVELGADPSQGSQIKFKANNISLEGLVTANGYFKILPDGSMEATNGKFSGQLVAASGTFTGTLLGADGTFTGTLSGGAITGSTFDRTVGGIVWTKIDDYGFYQYVGGGLTFQVGYYYQNGYIYSDGSGIQMGASGSALSINQYGVYINGSTPITSANIGSQDVYSLRGTVYVSANGNFRPFNSGGSSCGTADGKWSSVWAVNGTIQTSDERQKLNIKPLEDDERFLKFAKMIVPYTYQMAIGTSGRWHVGFIAQRIEEAMNECGISSAEFAGLVKAPVYAKKMIDKNGNELDEYDTSSEIIDYTYHLRYEEFIPLIFLWLRSLKVD